VTYVLGKLGAANRTEVDRRRTGRSRSCGVGEVKHPANDALSAVVRGCRGRGRQLGVGAGLRDLRWRGMAL
jgi:hypothetical protein